MPNTASAKKELRKGAKRALINIAAKKRVKETVKKAQEAAANKSADVATAMSSATKALDKAAKRNAIHPNKAARLKSRLQKKMNASK